MDNNTTTAPVAAPASTLGTQRRLDSAGAINIINKRITVTRAHIGSSLKLQIQGTGQFLDKGHEYTIGTDKRTNMYDRTIYNLRASSAELMKFHKPLFTEALAAEQAGELDKAHDLFNAYLNAIQLSFSVIEPSNKKFSSGDDVKATVALVVSQAGIESLQVEDVSYIAPTVVKATKFDVTDLINA